ncbi:ExbD/TolR family protein [Flavitalea flava]
MAELQTNEHRNKGKKQRTRKFKLSTRVDLTPMVDLGFLLITFFIFTTSMTRPTAMRLHVPDDRSNKDSSETAAGKTLNLVLGSHHTIWYYPGTDLQHAQTAGQPSALREIIIQQRKKMAGQYGNADELVVLIKPTKEASYGELIKVLDEMTIGQVKRFVLMEPGPDEKKLSEKPH